MTIRKILVLQLICLISVFYCYAGDNGSFTIGANAGPGLSAIYSTSAYVSNLRKAELSGSAGINFRYNFPKIVSIVSGIYYCQFGYNVGPNHNYNSPSRGAWNTINIPLLARVSFGKKVVFFAEVGPFLNIDLDLPGYLIENWVPPLPEGGGWFPTKTVNAGITAGAGIEVPLFHGFALSFEASSNLGLENITGGWALATDYVKAYSCTLLCGFSYTLPTRASKLKTADKK